MNKFKAPNIDQAASQLASNLPDGRAWFAKNLDGTKMRALVSACASEFLQIQSAIESIATEFDIRLTNELLPDWESSCGLPDDCIGQLNSLTERRDAVILRIRKIPFVTVEDFENLAFDLTGLIVKVTPGAEIELFPLHFPLRFSSGNSFFKLYVTFVSPVSGFPYDFPFNFVSSSDNIVRCVFEKIAPANVQIIFD